MNFGLYKISYELSLIQERYSCKGLQLTIVKLIGL